MQVRSLFAAAGVTMVLALGACSGENSGTPETETTGSVQSPAQTTDTATTGTTGGAVSDVTPEDKEFVSKAGMGGLAEVQMGTLAQQKATNPDVKAFAQRMVTDHSRANDELSQLATAKGLALPTELDAEHKAGMDHLSGLSGAEFDKAYMQHMVADHDKDVSEFEKAATSAQDADVKGWAAKTLPTLQDHQRQAKEIESKLE